MHKTIAFWPIAKIVVKHDSYVNNSEHILTTQYRHFVLKTRTHWHVLCWFGSQSFKVCSWLTKQKNMKKD